MRQSLLAVLLLTSAATPLAAETPWVGRVRIGLDVAAQLNTKRLDESLTLTKTFEPAPVTASLPNKTLPMVGGDVAIRLKRNFGVELGLSFLSSTGNANVAAQIPHPLLFNHPRPINGQASASHSETAAYVDGVYMIVGRRVDVAISGGLSVFYVSQDLVTDVSYVEQYPFDTATYTGASVGQETMTRAGYNIGVDATWKRWRRWGVGGMIRFSHARAPFTISGSPAGTVTVGGLQTGGGLRVRF
jgi:hypothetical protein